MADSFFKIPNALNYQGDSKNWKKFKQQFDIYMKASGLDKKDSENKVNIFLNIAGEEALEIFEILNLTPEEKKDYDLVIEAFESHCISKPNEIYKSFKFFTRVQQPSEYFSDFYDDLLVMASFCNFGILKDRLIRDRIIAGIRSRELQEKFLKSPDLSLAEVVNICLDNEVEKMNNRHFKCENVEVDLEEQNDESNNNYDSPDLDTSTVSLSTLEQINIPNEILFNDMAAEGYEMELNLSELESEMDVIDIKPNNILEANNSKKLDFVKNNLPDSKTILNETTRTTRKKVSGKPNDGSENKPLRKSNRNKAMQRNITEDEKKLSDVIKVDTYNEKTVQKKNTRSRLKMKKEQIEESEDSFLECYSVPVEDQDEYSEIANGQFELSSLTDGDIEVVDQVGNENYELSSLIEYDDEENELKDAENELKDAENELGDEENELEDVENEFEDVENEFEDEENEFEDEENELEDEENQVEDQDEYSQISHEDSVIFSSIESEQGEIEIEVNTENSHDQKIENNDASIGMVNEMAEAEYLLENSPKVLPEHKRKKRQKKKQSAKKIKLTEPTIIKVKRDNLPPLFLKAIKNKKYLLGKMPFACKKCDATFWTSFQLDKHQLVHVLKKGPAPTKPPSKVFKCEECGKEFKKICDLERHTRVHTGEKPSVCNICNKRFQQAYNLNKHLYTHTQEKNYECVICQKKFGRNDVLNRHVLTHSIIKPFRCSICSRTFIRNSQLKLHLRKHHDLDEDPGNSSSTVDEPVPGTSATTS